MRSEERLEVSEKKWRVTSILLPSPKEIDDYEKQYDLPRDVFTLHHFTEEVSRVERLESEVLGECLSLVMVNYREEKDVSATVEEALFPVSLIFSENQLLIVTQEQDSMTEIKRLFKVSEGDIPQFLVAYILESYTYFLHALKKQKQMIDQVNEAAKNSTEKDTLLLLRDIEKNLVYLEHTLDDQKHTTDIILENESVIEQVSKERLNDVTVSCRRVEKMVHLYRGLVDSTSGMVSALMDNTLNHLMKYLDSAALIISIPTLIFSLWGINTGGLIGKDSVLGSIGVVFLAVIATLIAMIFLRRKDYMS
ncbi:magnesium transporter [Enterococcus florum]|uniref:Magnesium transporter n=1 Tax=Enterococcus florum TaxID=2480627 RepID=A0A4P5PE44_9ENTE|nr:magnesium transporter CorA family protein [Enterococcus florum]GCF94378.1 magnesium transporter [Enterococcus florum]